MSLTETNISGCPLFHPRAQSIAQIGLEYIKKHVVCLCSTFFQTKLGSRLFYFSRAVLLSGSVKYKKVPVRDPNIQYSSSKIHSMVRYSVFRYSSFPHECRLITKINCNCSLSTLWRFINHKYTTNP